MLKSSTISKRSRRVVAGALSAAAVLGAGVVPGTASAAYTVTNGVSCNEAVKQVFSQFADTNWYALAPAGSFEGTLTGWSLAGGAGAISGSEPYSITGTAGKLALGLPAGASALSSPVCVDPTRDSFRFFVRNTSNTRARVKVEALFKKGGTAVGTYQVGYVTTEVGVWKPSPIMRNAASRFLTTGTTASVQYRFTAENGSMVVDDLHVDPRYIG